MLTAIVDAYVKKHVEVHRGMGSVGDFLSQETDQLRSRLSQTEDELRKAKDKAGIISLDDSKKAYAEQVLKIRESIYAAEAELAERSAMLSNLTKASPAAAKAAAQKNANAGPAVSSAILSEYRDVVGRLDWALKNEQQLLVLFTDQNERVKEVRAQIAVAQDAKEKLEEKYPSLPDLAAPHPETATVSNGIDVAAEASPLGRSSVQDKSA